MPSMPTHSQARTLRTTPFQLPVSLACLSAGVALSLSMAFGEARAQNHSAAPKRVSGVAAALVPTTAVGASAGSATLTCSAGAANATSEDAAPPSASFNRLHLGTVMQFDARTRTVGDAMASLLGPVRYRVTSNTVNAAASAALMRQPLPVAARDAGYMTIEQGLLLLIGQDNRLVVDHRSRLVAVERTPEVNESSAP
jgi:hypothetical protein